MINWPQISLYKRVAVVFILTLLTAVGSLIFSILKSQEPALTRSNICAECSIFEQFALVLQPTAAAVGGSKFELALLPAPQASLAKEIRLVFGTFGKTVDLLQGTIFFKDSLGHPVCSYSITSLSMKDNQPLRFVQDMGCKEPRASSTAILELRTSGANQLALWVKGPLPENLMLGKKAALFVDSKSGSLQGTFSPLGELLSLPEQSQVNIFSRIAFLWSLSALQLAAELILSILFFDCCLVLILLNKPSSTWMVLLVACTALSIGSLQSVLTPPFQAPDEPDHALTMANAMNAPQLTQRFSDLAKKTHLERIKFRENEKFLTADMAAPAPIAWGDHVAATELSRSALSTRVWRLLQNHFGHLSGPSALLAMRILQSVLFACAAALGTLALQNELRIAVPALWLTLPTLPFFAMHLSNYGPLSSLALLFSACTVALLWGSKRATVGLLLGLSIGLLLSVSRSVWAFAPLFASVCVLGLFVQSNSQAQWKNNLKYWLALALGLSSFWIVSTPDYLAQVNSTLSIHMPQIFRPIFKLFVETPLVLPLFVLLMVLLEPVFRLLISTLRSKADFLCKYAFLFVCVGIAASYFLPFLKPALVVPDIEVPDRIPLLSYLKKSIMLCAALFRATNHDFYMIHSFFGGFGWLETLLPNWTTSLIVGLAAVGLVCAAWSLKRVNDALGFVRLALIFLGGIVSVGLAAKGNWEEGVNLHGRYLIPYHLTFMAACFSGFAKLPDLMSERFNLKQENLRSTLNMILLTVACFLQCYAMIFVLHRYFVPD